MYTLGIDIAKRTFDVALLAEEAITSASFSNDKTGFRKLRKWLKKRGVKQVWACMEATGTYGEGLAYFLHEAGHQVSVVNPMQIKKYADSKLQRNKTDKQDAKLIADYCHRQEPYLWSPPPVERQELQELVRRLDGLIRDHTREKNRLQSGHQSAAVVKSIKSHVRFLAKEIKRLEAEISDHIDQHPALKEDRELLTSIPGIGEKTACHLLGELPDVSRFRSAKQVIAYASLSPSQHQTGAFRRKRTAMTPIGRRSFRYILYFPALVAKKHNPIIRKQAERLQKRGKAKMVIVGAAMRKLLSLVYGVLKTRQPFDPDYYEKTMLSA